MAFSLNLLSHIPPSVFHQVVLSLPSKTIQNLTTSHCRSQAPSTCVMFGWFVLLQVFITGLCIYLCLSTVCGVILSKCKSVHVLRTPLHLSQDKSCKVLKVGQKALNDRLYHHHHLQLPPHSRSPRNTGYLAVPLTCHSFFIGATLSSNSHMICSLISLRSLCKCHLIKEAFWTIL